MKTIARVTAVIFSAALLVGLSGCFGSGGGSGSNVPTGEIIVQANNNGVLQGVQNAIVNGYTIPGYYNCDPNSDSNCITRFDDGYTNASGDFTFSSDALPGDWNIGVGDANGCSGANTGWVQWSPSIPIQITCGSVVASNVTVSPTGCMTTEYSNQPPTSNCPSTVTITVTSPLMPTSHGLTVGAYNEAATKLATNTITASSTTQMVAPLPNAPGHDIIFIISDPTTSQTIGGVEFVSGIRNEIRK